MTATRASRCGSLLQKWQNCLWFYSIDDSPDSCAASPSQSFLLHFLSALCGLSASLRGRPPQPGRTCALWAREPGGLPPLRRRRSGLPLREKRAADRLWRPCAPDPGPSSLRQPSASSHPCPHDAQLNHGWGLGRCPFGHHNLVIITIILQSCFRTEIILYSCFSHGSVAMTRMR